MCLIGLALDAHPRFELVIAANRDEFFARPSEPLDWWRRSPQSPWLLSGRDLSAGGTWMGLSEQGRIGMLTNVRDPARHRDEAASRGALVTAWLEDGQAPRAPHATNPFNLIGGELGTGRWWWTSDRHDGPAEALGRGVHAISNGALNEPWPKVRRLATALRETLDAQGDDANEDALAAQLFAQLDDRRTAADHELPDTGIGLERERALSSVFIHLPHRGYGTRCSTVVIGRRSAGHGWLLRVMERSIHPGGRSAGLRAFALETSPQGALLSPPAQLSDSAIS